MANRKRNTGELRYQKLTWGDIWTGTAEQLIAAGLVELGQLPGQPGNPKVCTSFGNRRGGGEKAPILYRDADYLHIQRYGRHRYIVTRGISSAEQERREIEDKAKHKEEREAMERQRIEAANRERCELLVSSMASTEERYRGRLEGKIDALRTLLTGEVREGFRFADHELARADALLSELSGIAERGRVIFDQEERNSEIRQIYQAFNLEPPVLPSRARPQLRLVK